MKTAKPTGAVLHVGHLKKIHRMRQPLCPCGSRDVVRWLGSIPSCQSCLDKDQAYYSQAKKGLTEEEIAQKKLEAERLRVC